MHAGYTNLKQLCPIARDSIKCLRAIRLPYNFCICAYVPRCAVSWRCTFLASLYSKEWHLTCGHYYIKYFARTRDHHRSLIPYGARAVTQTSFVYRDSIIIFIVQTLNKGSILCGHNTVKCFSLNIFGTFSKFCGISEDEIL